MHCTGDGAGSAQRSLGCLALARLMKQIIQHAVFRTRCDRFHSSPVKFFDDPFVMMGLGTRHALGFTTHKLDRIAGVSFTNSWAKADVRHISGIASRVLMAEYCLLRLEMMLFIASSFATGTGD